MFMLRDKYINELMYFKKIKKLAIRFNVVDIDLFRLVNLCIKALDEKAKNNKTLKIIRDDAGKYQFKEIHSINDSIPSEDEYIYYETMYCSKYGLFEFENKIALKKAYWRLRNEKLRDID